MLCSRNCCGRNILSSYIATSLVLLKKHSTQSYSKNVGDPNLRPYNDTIEMPLRWKLHWVNNMRRKAEIEGASPLLPRSSQIDWNFQAELNAFK